MLQRFSPTAVGRWSTRRAALAIAGWLSLVVLAVLALATRRAGSRPLAYPQSHPR